MALGAFYPFTRNHNTYDTISQEPYAFGATSPVLASSKRWLSVRYSLLPHLYNLFFQSYQTGLPVMRPLLYSYPQDTNTWDLDTQFMLGGDIHVCPVLDAGLKAASCFIPNDDWFFLENGARLAQYQATASSGTVRSIDAPLDYIVVLVRGGSVLPRQYPALTTDDTRANPFFLTVAMSAEAGSATVAQRAVGSMVFDDGVTLPTAATYSYCTRSFSMVQYRDGVWALDSTLACVNASYGAVPDHTPPLDRVDIFGYLTCPSSVNVDYANLSIVVSVLDQHAQQVANYSVSSSLFDHGTGVFTVQGLNVPMNASFVLSWNDTRSIAACRPGSNSDNSWKVGVGVGVGLAFVAILVGTALYFKRRSARSLRGNTDLFHAEGAEAQSLLRNADA